MRVLKIFQPRTTPLKRGLRGKKNFKKVVQITVKLTKQGKVIICPTDTLYGLIANATNTKAVKKIFKIKKRRKEKAIPIFVKDMKMAKKLACINKDQEAFLKKVWFTRPNFRNNSYKEKKLVKITPKIWVGKGKVTAVLKRRKARTKLYGVARDTIALRIPKYKLLNVLLKKLSRPLTGTSANISGKPASGNIKEVLRQFGYSYSYGRIRISRGRRAERALFACPDLVIDAGNLPKSKPSTVLDLTTLPPKILRE